MISVVKKLLKHFMKNNYKRLIKKIMIEKGIKRNYISNGKFMIIRLIVGLIKKI